MHSGRLLTALTLPFFSLACSDDDSPPPSGNAGSGGSGNTELALTSTAFAAGEMIPEQYGCPGVPGGQNVSPPLAWTGGPSDAQSYAIVMRDIDFAGFLHWVIFDIPKGRSLPEGVEAAFEPGNVPGAKQSRFVNASGAPGYFGPCSPNSVNTYQFTVHALPEATLPGMTDQSTNQDAATAIEAASLASAPLPGES
jgi:Raf kinase inhibitor-like YbhB/YbcL family protein